MTKAMVTTQAAAVVAMVVVAMAAVTTAAVGTAVMTKATITINYLNAVAATAMATNGDDDNKGHNTYTQVWRLDLALSHLETMTS